MTVCYVMSFVRAYASARRHPRPNKRDACEATAAIKDSHICESASISGTLRSTVGRKVPLKETSGDYISANIIFIGDRTSLKMK